MNDDSYIDAQFLNTYNLTRSWSEPYQDYNHKLYKWAWPYGHNVYRKRFWEAYEMAVDELMKSPIRSYCDLKQQKYRKRGYSDAFYLYKDDVSIYNQVASAMFKHRVFLEMASPTAMACIPNHSFFINCNHGIMKHRKTCVHMHPVKYMQKNTKRLAMNRLDHIDMTKIPRVSY